jgi:hypothetical protein
MIHEKELLIYFALREDFTVQKCNIFFLIFFYLKNKIKNCFNLEQCLYIYNPIYKLGPSPNTIIRSPSTLNFQENNLSVFFFLLITEYFVITSV